VYYDGGPTKPCAYVGHGGLGSYWHGIVATADHDLAGASAASYETVVHRFYPNTQIVERLGSPWIFVPWRPIRPKREWVRLKMERADRLTVEHDIVSRFTVEDNGVCVHAAKSKWYGKRLWVCAGALHSPALLDRSFNIRLSRTYVSDHVFCYLGRIDRSRTTLTPPRVRRTRDGVWFEGRADTQREALYLLRPARFSFARLDTGIERRRLFGPPTGNSISNIVRGTSLGLIAEALYNRTGLFPNASVYNVYAQINAPDAHRFSSGNARPAPRKDVIQSLVDAVRVNQPWSGMQPSKRPDIFMPSVHLHHSVDVDALTRAGANGPTSRVQVLDASVLRNIGTDHHSLKLMAAAFHRARTVAEPT
jgi:hypothetical protein